MCLFYPYKNVKLLWKFFFTSIILRGDLFGIYLSGTVMVFSVCVMQLSRRTASSKPDTGTTNGLRNSTQFGVSMREKLATVGCVAVGMRGIADQVK